MSENICVQGHVIGSGLQFCSRCNQPAVQQMPNEAVPADESNPTAPAPRVKVRKGGKKAKAGAPVPEAQPEPPAAEDEPEVPEAVPETLSAEKEETPSGE